MITASMVKTRDGASIFYKDWGVGPVILFSHGWPLNADAWEDQMFSLASAGFRCIAHDRRSHGRSSQTWHGNDMDTYADDLATVVDTLDLTEVTHVGHSTGGGEVARYVGRHGTSRVSKIVLVSAVPPIMLKSAANPYGTSIEAFDSIRRGVEADRSRFYQELSRPFYGYNRPGAAVSEGIRAAFWQQSMMAGLKGAHDCIREFSEQDFTGDLAKFDVPTLIIHGDDDQIVPIEASAKLSARQVGGAELTIYPGAPHGLMVTHRERFNDELATFARR